MLVSEQIFDVLHREKVPEWKIVITNATFFFSRFYDYLIILGKKQ